MFEAWIELLHVDMHSLCFIAYYDIVSS